MRKVWLAALGAAAGLAAAGSANAWVLSECLTGCLVYDGFFFADYTVPDDGRLYRWDLYTDAPGATIGLSAPNEWFDTELVSNGDGTTHGDAFLPGYAASFTWNETQDVGHTQIYTQSLNTAFNHCGAASPAGEVCAVNFNIWGNGSMVTLARDGVGLRDPENYMVYLKITAIPEPATWAMMILGFFGLGAALRRRRPALAA